MTATIPHSSKLGTGLDKLALQGPGSGVGTPPTLPPTQQEHTAPLDVMGIQRKSLLEALLGFGCFLKKEAERSIVQPVLDVALVLSYPLDKRDHRWSEDCCNHAQHIRRTGKKILE